MLCDVFLPGIGICPADNTNHKIEFSTVQTRNTRRVVGLDFGDHLQSIRLISSSNSCCSGILSSRARDLDRFARFFS